MSARLIPFAGDDQPRRRLATKPLLARIHALQRRGPKRRPLTLREIAAHEGLSYQQVCHVQMFWLGGNG